MTGPSIDASALLARATPEGEAEYQALITQLRTKWPDLQPVKRQPSLPSGDTNQSVALIRRLDEDRDTRSHTTWLAVRVGVIPIAFLRAYRVYETERGALVCIGRLPLPDWVRFWNACL